jgi:chromate transporter
MHRELVDERRWIGERRFLHALSYCTLLPGPEAQQLSIYLGWLLNGTAGGLTAGVLFVLPGYVVLMALSAIYAQWGTTTVVTALFAGLAPAVLAIVWQSLWRLGKRALRRPLLVTFAGVSFVMLFAFGVAFPIVVASGALAGFVAGRLKPSVFGGAASGTAATDGPAPLIADEQLYGASPSLRRALAIIGIGGVLWALPVVLASIVLGGDHVFVDQGLFFSGTAVVTFGGAYAVLSFVAQRAVETYGWLSAGEMVKGLALAESTPGPLIMVVQFVGFLGAFRNPGDLNPWVAGVVGATLVVWVTFVPCFLFVFLGAPHIERLRGNRSLSAALTGITAAVVGVIANLSIYLTVHTLFRSTRVRGPGPIDVVTPVWSSINWTAVAVVALASALVFIAKFGVLRVLAICAIVGAALHLLVDG